MKTNRSAPNAFQLIYYWSGVASAIGCLVFILAGNTAPVWTFEHAGFPVSWALGAFAIVAFLAAELSDKPAEDGAEVEPYIEALRQQV
jgi:hypothetical protein